MEELIEYGSERCVGCGDFAEYCTSGVCRATFERHNEGDHSGCDMLACGEASVDSLDPWSAQSPLNVVYIPSHRLGLA